MSIVDKHNRPIKTAGYIGSVSIGNGFGAFKIGGDIDTWGSLDDQRTIIWIGEGSHFEYQMSLQIGFEEIGQEPGKPFIGVLDDFIRTAESIIDLFDAP